MTNSGQWEIWKATDGFRVRHCVGQYPCEKEMKKAWKRLTMFASPAEAGKYEQLIPSVPQQLALKEQAIINKGHAQPIPRDLRSFEQILLAKVDQKRKQYVGIEKQERLHPHVKWEGEKARIRGGITALRWVHQAYQEYNQLELVK